MEEDSSKRRRMEGCYPLQTRKEAPQEFASSRSQLQRFSSTLSLSWERIPNPSSCDLVRPPAHKYLLHLFPIYSTTCKTDKVKGNDPRWGGGLSFLTDLTLKSISSCCRCDAIKITPFFSSTYPQWRYSGQILATRCRLLETTIGDSIRKKKSFFHIPRHNLSERLRTVTCKDRYFENRICWAQFDILVKARMKHNNRLSMETQKHCELLEMKEILTTYRERKIGIHNRPIGYRRESFK